MAALDVACGTGNASIPAAKLGARVTGLDFSPGLIAIARERGAEAKVGSTGWKAMT
jgi:2-polyprenyl-3-methyl-5-hydroxy-6-metoxy-1,4-benzoquinol methylase